MNKASEYDWQALESNPEAINDYLKKIGVKTDKFCVYELLGMEEWAYAMIPKPVVGVIFLFPHKAFLDEFVKKEKERIKKEG